MKVIAVSFLTLAVTCLFFSSASADTFRPAEIRVSESIKKFDDVRQFALAFEMPAPRRLRARHLEMAVGSISDSENKRAFVSFGPVWQLPILGNSLFARMGISPTLIGGSTFNHRTLGGNFHFTSSIAIGATLGRFDSVSVLLRAQHTSNGGLSGTNPGIDMLGLSFVYNFNAN